MRRWTRCATGTLRAGLSWRTWATREARGGRTWCETARWAEESRVGGARSVRSRRRAGRLDVVSAGLDAIIKAGEIKGIKNMVYSLTSREDRSRNRQGDLWRPRSLSATTPAPRSASLPPACVCARVTNCFFVHSACAPLSDDVARLYPHLGLASSSFPPTPVRA
mgnify:CR=1 FL=1